MKTRQGEIIFTALVFGVMQGALLTAADDPHPGDPAKSSEHLAMLALTPESDATHRVFQSGDWSSADTWDNPATEMVLETPPGDGGKVLIPTGITLTVDGVIPARLAWIRVNGKLRFSPSANTELNVETIIVDPNGVYEQGTFEDLAHGLAAEPIANSVRSVVRFIDTGAIDRVFDPFGLSRGLISHGTARIHGAEATPYAFLVAPAMAGDTVIHLQTEPVNWELGEEVVVPAVDYVIGLPEGIDQGDLDERCRIESIEYNAVTDRWDVSLNRALVFDHAPPLLDPADPQSAPAFAVPVAYLHRNVVYTSENTSTPRRGHVMFMHSANVLVANALFEQLGRTSAQTEVTDPQVDASHTLDPATTGNDRGRYALHVHRAIPSAARKVKITGVCVNGSPKLGIVNHDSNVDVQYSVVFGATGSAFFTEIGTELGTFDRCLALHTMGGVGEMEDRFRHTLPGGADFGFNGVGFWLQGGGVAVTDCMAFNTRREGFVAETVTLTINGALTRFLASNLEDPAWVTQSKIYYAAGNEGYVGVDEVALSKFDGNLAVAATTAMVVRKHNPIGRPTEIKNFKAYNLSARGIGADYGGPTTFRNVTLRGGTSAYPGTPLWRGGNAWKGITMNGSNKGFVFDNVDIRRFEVGLHYVNNWENLPNSLSNSHFDNILNIEAFVTPSSEAVLQIENTTFSYTTPLLNDPANPRFNAYHDLVLTSYPDRPSSQIWWLPPAESDPEHAQLLTFPSHGSISYRLSESRPPSQPILESFISRKVHGASGAFDLYLPVSNSAAGVEGRSGGPDGRHQLILTFDRLLADGAVQMTAVNPETSITPVINQNQLIIDLAGVSDQQWMQFTLADLSDFYGNVLTQPQAGPELIPSPNRVVGFFVGDTNADGVVNAEDLAPSQVVPGPVDGRTFRADVNGDGVVSFLDVETISNSFGEIAGGSQLIRYALGLDLRSGDGAGLPHLSIDESELALTYTRALGATDVQFQALWSDDLSDWSVDGILTEVIEDDGKIQRVRASIPRNGVTQKYMRLEISTQ